MKRQSDDEWLIATRARFAEDGAEFDIEPDFSPDETPARAFQPGRCPHCAGRPALSRFPYTVLPSPVPAEVCAVCLGVWAPPGSISAGVNLKVEGHAAFRASRPPQSCANCFGAMMPNGECAKCHERSPALQCPACGTQMQRLPFGRDWLDYCSDCKGTWYGTGELPAIYGVTEDPSLGVIAMEAQNAENIALYTGVAAGAAALGGGGLLGGLGRALGSLLRR